nr:hypothetical protein [Comamonas sp. NoAH]
MPGYEVSGWFGLLAPAGTPKGFGISFNLLSLKQ